MATGDARRMKVLEAIVREYVSNNEPVGSQALVERYDLGVSPATVRNDMNALEEAGLITQPHTSAGRVPTDAGYRVIVDATDTLRPISAPERRAIERLLAGALDLDDVLARAAKALASITHQVAIIQYPSLRRASIHRIELVPVGEYHVLVILITGGGHVDQRHLRVDEPVDPDALASLELVLNRLARDVPTDRVAQGLVDAADERGLVSSTAKAVLSAIGSMLKTEGEEKLALSGTASLSRQAGDFRRSIEPVLDALEEQVVLVRLLSLMDGDPSVAIGQESGTEELSETSVISSTYGAGGGTVARVGVVGPTRMNYRTNMAAVQAVARYLSRELGSE